MSFVRRSCYLAEIDYIKFLFKLKLLYKVCLIKSLSFLVFIIKIRFQIPSHGAFPALFLPL